MKRSAGLLALAAALAGCSDPECFIGSASSPPELSLVARSVDGRVVPITDGSIITLAQPPQGGKVIFVGPRARNVSCVVQITAALKEESSGRLVGTEGRPVILAKGADGWGEPSQPVELSNYANLAACPGGNIAIRQDIFGKTYVLSLHLEDRHGHTVDASAHVLPTCNEPGLENQCQCECSGSYVLGQGCAPADGGAPDGGSADGGTSASDAGTGG
jgi:hypothetical protein